MVNINPTDLNSLINQRANQSSSFASNPTDLNNQISQNASFSTLHSNEIRSQLNSNHANNPTNYADFIHRPNQASSQHLSQLISAVRRAARSYNQTTNYLNRLNNQLNNMSTPLRGMQRIFQAAHFNTERYTSLIRSLSSEIVSVRRGLRSGATTRGRNASDIQRQIKNIHVGRGVLNRAPTSIRASSNSYGKQLSRDLSASVPAMSVADFISHKLNNTSTSNLNGAKGKALVEYQRLHLNDPLRGLSERMSSVLRPFKNAKKRGRMTQRTYISAQNNADRFFGKSGEYRQIAHIIASRIRTERPTLRNRENILSRQLGLNRLGKNAINSDGTINKSTRVGRGSLASLLRTAKSGNSGRAKTAQAYLKNSTELENLNSIIPSLRDELSALVSGINYMTSQMSGTNGNYIESNDSKSPDLPNISQYHVEAQKSNSKGYNGSISKSPLSRFNPNKITLRPDPKTLQGAIFNSIIGGVTSAIPAYFAQLKSNDNSGNQLRMQEGPQVYSQVLGNSINGGITPYKEDNILERRMNGQAYRYGENPEQVAQNLQSLVGTRDTNNQDMTSAAINEGRFERANNVAPQVAQQLFSTLGQGGGLGSRGNQVNSNLSSLSAQFAGMLNRDHLGAMGTQQAQGLNSIFGSMLNSGQSITPNTAGNVMAMQSVLSQGHGGQVFQGQQGAQQLTAFSHGVGGAFNNQLIRNAFAGGMPQYGGQQGLYKLQMDMQEPLKHPTQLNNMIQGMSSIAGPAGAEDALTQMGLGPSAAKQIYRKAMTGQLTESNLRKVQRQNKHRGQNTQDRALRAYNRTGTSTIDKLSSIRKGVSMIVSMLGDGIRRGTNRIEGPISNTYHGALEDSGLHLLGSVAPTVTSLGGSELLGHLLGGKGSMLSMLTHMGGSGFHPFLNPRSTFRGFTTGIRRAFNPVTWRAVHRGFKEGTGWSDRIRHIRASYREAYNLGGNTPNVIKNATTNGSLINKSHDMMHTFGSYIPRINGPLGARALQYSKRIPHVGNYISKAGSLLAKHPQALKAGKSVGHFAGRALDYAAPISGIWTAGHYLKQGRPLRAISGGLDSALSNSDVGLGADILGGGAKMLGMHSLGNGIEKLGNSPLHSLGKLLGFDNTANASTRKGAQGSSEAHTHTRHSVYYWLRRINRLLPALAKKMSGFSDVDPSLAGNTSSYTSSKTNNGVTNPNKQSVTKPGTSTTPNGPSSNSGAKSYNGTGNSGVNAKDTAATIEPAQVSSNYFDATLGTTNNTDDHSRHEDSHNVYKNYINAPSQNFLSKLMENSQKAQAYFGHTHQTEWG